MRDRWCVAILDSGLRETSARLDSPASFGAAAARVPMAAFGPAPVRDVARIPEPLASCRFIDDGREVLCSAVVPDPLGHGTAVAEVIYGSGHAARECDILVGQVLDQRGLTTAAALAAAINWSLRRGANLIHMSLGLREDRRILAEAVAAASEAGCIIVASAPARGEGTYPARYEGVIRATGDARCQWDEISDLHSKQADFGGCPRYVGSASSEAARLGGASLGAAHVTRFLVAHITPWLDASAVRAQLAGMARHLGVEARTV